MWRLATAGTSIASLVFTWISPPDARAEPTAGPNDTPPTAAAELRERYVRLSEAGDYTAALGLARRACALLEANPGPSTPEFATCSNNLARILHLLGEHGEAETLYLRALAIRERALGLRHMDVASSSNGLALLYIDQVRLDDAERLLLRTLSIREQALGAAHVKVGETLNNLAMVHITRGNHDEAEPLLLRALSIQEATLGPEHLQVTTTLDNLGVLLSERGSYDEAKVMLERTLAIHERMLGLEHPQVAVSLNNLAKVLHDQGDDQKAIALMKRALRINEQALGPEHPRVALGLHNLATLWLLHDEHEEALPLLERALSLSEGSLGRDHPQVAADLRSLARSQARAGRYDDARLLLERALSIDEAALGLEDLAVASSLEALAMLDIRQGRYATAEARLERALDITRRALGNEHHRVATSLEKRAMPYLERGRFADALPLVENALRIDEKVLGPDHPSVASHFINLGEIHRRLGDLERAEALHVQALHINERVFGPEHLHVATSVLDLGLLEMDRRQPAQARALFQRAVLIYERWLGPSHPDLARALRYLGTSHLALGERDSATDLHQRALDIEESSMSQTLLVAEESHRLALAETLTASTHGVLSLHLQAMPDDRRSAELALSTVLLRKGRVQDLAALANATLRRTLSPAHEHILDELAATNARYATLAQRGPGKRSHARFASELGMLEAKRDTLWRTLAQHGHTASHAEPVTLDDVQGALPKDGALVEYIQYRPCFEGDSLVDDGPPRYAAYLVFPDHIDWVDLGPASVVDEQIVEFRHRLLHDQSLPRGLYDHVLAPVLERMGSAREIFISPDGELSRVPFGALHDGERYLVERHSIRYVRTGRDLLRPRSPRTGSPSLVLAVANPTGTDLPGTEREAELVARLFAPVRTLVHDEATEARVRQHARPRLLHIGTHGFYDQPQGELALEHRTNERTRWRIPCSDPLSSCRTYDPMLSSGLVLATPNAAHADDTDDGRLTAYEVRDWDLRGTELVVLSACGSALGTTQTGEGVLGLQRAFATAGAQTLVTGLWELGDDSTPAVLERYYHKLAAGVGRSDAMQQTQLELLADGRPPREWAAFVVVGDWGPLSWIEPEPEGPPPARRARSCQASLGSQRNANGLATLGLLSLWFSRGRQRPRRAPPSRPR